MESTSQPQMLKSSKKVVLPFLDTTFGTDLLIVLILWPLWWILGIDQFVPIVFLIWEAFRYLFLSGSHFRLEAAARWSILLAIWWVVPIMWVERADMDIFLKEVATIVSQVLILILFSTAVRSRRDWYKISRGLSLFAVYFVTSGLLYVTGIWQKQTISLIGLVLPETLIQTSEFFSSISIRNLGMVSPQKFIFTYRASGLALQASGLSMICMLLIPLIYWQFYRSKRIARIGWLILLVGLILTLIQTESRTGYLAFAFGLAIMAILRSGLLYRSNRIFFFSLVALSTIILIGGGYLVLEEIKGLLYSFFVQARTGSFSARLIIYQETIRLLPQHWIAGWGQPVRIPGLRSVFSAGTHNSYLGMLFQHGIVGLLLYLCIWISIWIVIIKGLRERQTSSVYRMFWIISAAAMISFNAHEAADSWWWDQSITMTLWTFWGLIITAPRIFSNGFNNKLDSGEK